MMARRIVACIACLAAGLWIFGGVLVRPHNFAYRDAGHFYYPLFQYVQSEWQQGRVPLWNPYQNGGEPLAANATSSVWYPGKLLFALPLDYDLSYKFYILAHVALAGAAMAWLMRAWGSSLEAAALAALSYALGAHVMFQYANVVFLCGAAWLPAAVLAGDKLLATRDWPWAACLGAVLALMVTAGDPQMAYQAGLAIALLALVQWHLERQAQAPQSPPEGRSTGKQRRLARKAAAKSSARLAWPLRRPVLLAQAAVWGVALGAVQVIPSAELTRRTERAFSDVPRSVWEIPGYLLRASPAPPHTDGTPAAWHDGLRGRPPRPLSHERHRFDFSVPPWRVAEMLWPNFSGRPFPEHRRWLTAVSDEASFWTPSLYMGLLPLLLAISVFSLRRGDARIRWLIHLALLGLLGAMGSYGLGWAIRQIVGSTARLPFSNEVGGVYWLLSIGLPGFAQFRFPGKLMVVAAFALAALSARGWDRLSEALSGGADESSAPLPARRLLRSLAVLGLLSFAAALLLVPLRGGFMNAFAQAAPDSLFGPFNAAGAWGDLERSLVHTAVQCGVWFALLWWCRTRADVWPWLRMLVVPLCALDLAVANGWMVLTAPHSAWHGTSELARQMSQGNEEPVPVRYYEIPDLALPAWRESSNSGRAGEAIAWDRELLRPNFHLTQRMSSVRMAGTTILYDFEQLMSPAVRPGDVRPEYVRPRRSLDAWGARYFVISPQENEHDSTNSTLGLRRQWKEPRWSPQRPQPEPEGEPLPALEIGGESKIAGSVDVLVNTDNFPRAWIVHQVFPIEPIESHDVLRLQGVLQSLVFPDQQWIDMRRQAVVENAALAAVTGGKPMLLGEPDGEEPCRITRYEPNRVELEVRLNKPGLVVLSDTYFPGWQLEAETAGKSQQAEVLRTNRMMRGALLPAGEHRLVFSYRPGSFRWGAAISLAAMAALAAVLGLSLRRGSGRSKGTRHSSGPPAETAEARPPSSNRANP